MEQTTVLAIIVLSLVLMHVATIASLMFKEHVTRFIDGLTAEEIYLELRRRARSGRPVPRGFQRWHSEETALPPYERFADPDRGFRPKPRAEYVARPRAEVPEEPRADPRPRFAEPMPMIDEMSIGMSLTDAYQPPSLIGGMPFEGKEGLGAPMPAYRPTQLSTDYPMACKNINTFNF